MLKVEVNKNEALLEKANSTAYQFQLINKNEGLRLLVVGNGGKDAAHELADRNYKYLQTDTVADALFFLEKTASYPNELPTAIICDLQLADGTAFDLYKKIQGNYFLSVLPFIVTADTSDEEMKLKARDMGIDDFYTTPVNPEDLHVRIAFLKQFKKEKRKFNFSNEMVFENRISLLKRTLDVAISGGALLILSPVLLLVALIIKLESRGPAVYVSKRVGTGYNIFNLYKFRSMRQGADVELKNLAHLNQYKDQSGNKAGDMKFFKLDNDPRVTLFGKFLRASSIDEIPQLLNVIKGDMSIVGNRPLPLYEAEQLTRDVWAKRFLAPAGLTGLWQVSRRGGEEMSVSERVILDNTYADNHSLWLDIKIILKTFPALVSKIHS
jgi:lipopolysaccharide/colanic/teichoic acid biosynthesis glycosyltransferase